MVGLQAILPAVLSFAELSIEADPGLAWVRQAQDGDHDAFARLVAQHQRRVFQLCGRFFRRPEDVEEAAQETFLRAWRKLDHYSERAPFEHWLTRVCLNTCLGILRRDKRRVTSTENLSFEPPAPTQDADAGMAAAQLIGRLPAADAMVLRLLHTEGWSIAELAERLGWSQANVKVRAHRARRRLRRWVESDLLSVADGEGDGSDN